MQMNTQRHTISFINTKIGWREKNYAKQNHYTIEQL